jgi:hypothetical protein
MMLDEKPLMTLQDVAKKLPAPRGKGHVSYCTVWRWALRGIDRCGQRIKLETALIGGTRFTSWPAVQRFVASLSATDQPRSNPARPNKPRQTTEAKKKLATFGF